MSFKARIKQHISENRPQYIIVIFIFLVGLVMGNYQVLGLDGGTKSQLSSMVEGYLRGGIDGSPTGSEILGAAFFKQVQVTVLLWFLGLTVIGFPLILGFVWFRGFSLGFTISFLLHDRAGAGLLITVISVLPQNLIYIPVFLAWSVTAINFSIYVLKGRNSGVSLGRAVMGYTILMLVYLLIFLAGAFVEAYLSPWFLSLIL
ncbi:MAG TPA: stage II sporulation protein M [Syntrophomonas sp.]|mgnify:FL=1|jgi:stage II sporulation protein M|nr:stage II sporulation protein M [Syntrophomonas sp.]